MNLYKKFYKNPRLILIFIVLIVLVVGTIGALITVRASQSNFSLQDSIFQEIPTSEIVINPSETKNWKINSDNRPIGSFTIKYPPDWNEETDYCIKAPEPNGLDLSANCLRLVIFTDKIPPDDEFSSSRDLVLTSKTKITIQGYQAIRKIYSLGETTENIPDTYQVWVYNENKPIMLFIGWLGVGTEPKTADKFVKTLDKMVKSIEFY